MKQKMDKTRILLKQHGIILQRWIKTQQRVYWASERRKTKKWITPETWRKINKRRKAKDNLLNGKSPRLTQRAKEEYKIKDI